jgi:hypothetical protein
VAPHLKAQKDINGKYNPVVHALKAAVKAIGAAQTAWANAKLQRQLQAEREEAAKRDEEARQRQAEVARAEAENRPPPPPPPPRPEPQPTVLRPQEFRGGTGRMAKEEFEDAITAVLDWKALFAWSSDDAQAQALVLDRAKRRFKDTGEIPAGVEIGKVAKIRR